jgi:hypothetical protein
MEHRHGCPDPSEIARTIIDFEINRIVDRTSRRKAIL